MPLNNNLEPIELPMDLKFDENPTTVFTNNLRALNTELVDAPTTEQARNVAWHYVKATWADRPEEVNPASASDAVKSKNLLDVLQFRALPTPMECLGFTFRLSGLSFQEVTHIIESCMDISVGFPPSILSFLLSDTFPTRTPKQKNGFPALLRQ